MGVLGAFLLLGVLLVSAVPDIRNGFSQAISGSFKDTFLIFGSKDQAPVVEEGQPNQGGVQVVVEEPREEQKCEDLDEPREDGNLEIHVIGSTGNAILFREGETTVLVDGSDAGGALGVVQYLKDLGVERLTYFVATNYHSTAIGGAKTILENIPTTYIVVARNVDSHEKGADLISYLKSSKLVWVSPKAEYFDLDMDHQSKVRVRLVRTHHEGSFMVYVENRSDKFVVTGDMTLVEEGSLRYLPMDVDYYFVGARSDIYTLPKHVLEHTNAKHLVIGAPSEGVYVNRVLDLVKDVEDLEVLKVFNNDTLVLNSNGLGYEDSIQNVSLEESVTESEEEVTEFEESDTSEEIEDTSNENNSFEDNADH